MKLRPASKSEAAAELETREMLRFQAAHPGTDTPKLKRILVPVDFSDCSLLALDYALALAEAFEAKVILLHIVEPAAGGDYTVLTPTLEETNQTLLQAGRERLAAVSRKQIGHRLPAETLVRMGHAPSEISDTAKALAADLIVLGTHGYTALKPLPLGSTAERVVRQATCPVLTVRSSATGRG